MNTKNPNNSDRIDKTDKTDNADDKNKAIEDMLQALADGQLDPNEREQILLMLEKDTKLRAELCSIYRIKNLMQTAYPLDTFEQTQQPSPFFGKRFITKAASYLLAFGLVFSAGYMVNEITNPVSKIVGEKGITLANVPVLENKVILFLSSSEPEKFIKALATAESYAQKFANTEGKVYVVTSARGIDLLRAESSPHKHQIKELTTLYPMLNFVACNNSLYQYEKAGKSTNLIDSAMVAPSAVEFVVEHLQRGWRYVAI